MLNEILSEFKFELGEKVYFITNENFKNYYVDEGEIYAVKITKDKKIYIEVYINRQFKSCDIIDVFKTREEAEIRLPSRTEYYLKINKRI